MSRSRRQRVLSRVGNGGASNNRVLSHLEIVGSLARLHLKPMKFDREYAEADP
jgi:hypothetical protein